VTGSHGGNRDLPGRIPELEAVIDTRPACPVCGAVIGNPELHQRFHDGLRDIARRIEAPDTTPEEYEQAIREQ
jgi:hypothetical protein